MKKLTSMTNKELLIQDAIGSLPEECRNNLCRYQTPEVAKGKRTCHLCGLKCINKGDEFYLADLDAGRFNRITLNICKSCSWLSVQTINRIINEYNEENTE